MAWDKEHSFFAFAFMYIDRVYIMDSTGSTKSSATGTVEIEPQVRIDARFRDGFAVDPNTKWAYKDIIVRDGRLYALFSGKSAIESDGHAAAELHVFDMSGHLLGAWTLEQAVRAIAFSDSSIYGARLEPHPALIRFALPPGFF